MPAIPARDRDPHLFTLLMAGAVCSQARVCSKGLQDSPITPLPIDQLLLPKPK
jgi:hypothetical protein